MGFPCISPSESYVLRQFPEPKTEQLWRDFLIRAECPAHYDSPEFFLEPYWKDQKPFAILQLKAGRVVAALTGFDQGSEITCGLPSRPQIRFAKDADVYATSQAFANALVAHFPRAKLITVYGWGSTALPGLADRGFRRLELEGDVVLDLRPGAKSLFDRLALNRRRDIRKALRNGIEVSEATTDADMEAYWSVYSAGKRTKRKRIHHDRDFAMLVAVQQMRVNHRRFLARYKGEVIAALGIRFYPGGLVEYANNCSRDEYLPLCPNDLLVWKMIEWACEGGFPMLSMGGAHPFLRKWSDTVIPIHRYRLDRTVLHREEIREEVTTQVRRLIHLLPAPMQTRLKALARFRTA